MRSSSLHRAAILVTCFVACVCLAENSILSRADKAFDELEFDQSATLYRQALKQPGSLEERAHAWRGLGMSQAFLGDAAGARKSFELLLLIDPEAKVKSSLGPKIARPFEAARKASQRGRPELRVDRDAESGVISAQLVPDSPALDTIVLHVHSEGRGAKVQTGKSPGPVTVHAPPEVGVEVFARALDAQRGTLIQAGTEQEPMAFPGHRPEAGQNAAVASAVDEVNEQRRIESSEDTPRPADEIESGSSWPWWVGGAVVVVGSGVAAAVLLSPPQTVNLPPAQRTGRLP